MPMCSGLFDSEDTQTQHSTKMRQLQGELQKLRVSEEQGTAMKRESWIVSCTDY